MKTPLHLACRKADLGMVQLLLESEEADPSPQDAQGFTPLHYRQTLENADITECLIQKGAAVDIPSKVYSYMSLYLSHSVQLEDVASFFIRITLVANAIIHRLIG